MALDVAALRGYYRRGELKFIAFIRGRRNPADAFIKFESVAGLNNMVRL